MARCLARGKLKHWRGVSGTICLSAASVVEFTPQQKSCGWQGTRMPAALAQGPGEANDDLYQRARISLLQRTNF
jgi:hypothetical protein